MAPPANAERVFIFAVDFQFLHQEEMEENFLQTSEPILRSKAALPTPFTPYTGGIKSSLYVSLLITVGFFSIQLHVSITSLILYIFAIAVVVDDHPPIAIIPFFESDFKLLTTFGLFIPVISVNWDREIASSCFPHP